MTHKTWFATLTAGSIAFLSACAPEPAPQVIYAEPTFDKLGNPSCRPGNVPVGGIYTADLPLCDVISGMPMAAAMPAMVDDDGNDTVVVPDIPDNGDDDDPTGGNQNQNQNQNENQNENQNQNNQQSGGN